MVAVSILTRKCRPQAAARWPGIGRCSAGAVTLLVSHLLRVAQAEWQCQVCNTSDAFTSVLKSPLPKQPGECTSDVHLLWPAHIEVVGLTTDVGGPEPPSFHERLAAEAIHGWRMFATEVVPNLPKDHHLKQATSESHAGALNDGFFHWQKQVFEAAGNLTEAVQGDGDMVTPGPEDNSSWPSMQALPEYRKLRDLVDKLSRRYLIRSGVSEEQVNRLEYSIFNWAAVHGPGEFHGPHTHVGEYHVGVFYAQVGPDAGKLRFGDPRGQNPPFGSHYLHTPKAGHLIFFPSWLSHMATVTSPLTSRELRGGDHQEPHRVVFSFNIGPVEGPLPCHVWFSDPTGDMRSVRQARIDPKELGFLDETFGVEDVAD